MKKDLDPLADRKSLIEKIDLAFALAAREAREENEWLGIPKYKITVSRELAPLNGTHGQRIARRSRSSISE